jgi:hypothetical protein
MSVAKSGNCIRGSFPAQFRSRLQRNALMLFVLPVDHQLATEEFDGPAILFRSATLEPAVVK